jgi:hypothetical protein
MPMHLTAVPAEVLKAIRRPITPVPLYRWTHACTSGWPWPHLGRSRARSPAMSLLAKVTTTRSQGVEIGVLIRHLVLAVLPGHPRGTYAVMCFVQVEPVRALRGLRWPRLLPALRTWSGSIVPTGHNHVARSRSPGPWSDLPARGTVPCDVPGCVVVPKASRPEVDPDALAHLVRARDHGGFQRAVQWDGGHVHRAEGAHGGIEVLEATYRRSARPALVRTNW